MKISEINFKPRSAPSADQKKFVQDMIRAERKRGEKMVKGSFEFCDAPGATLNFPFKKYPGQPILDITISDGEVCDLPLDLVKHLNNSKKTVRTGKKEIGGEKTFSIETRSRLRFVPVDVEPDEIRHVAEG